MTRAALVLVLGSGIGLLAFGCFPTALPPCTQSAALEARYVSELVAGCADSGPRMAECPDSLPAAQCLAAYCPDFETIKAAHTARMKEAHCRY